MIDWERAMWSDCLFSNVFRSHRINKYICEGIQKKEFTRKETVRMHWYDLYCYSVLMAEAIFRKSDYRVVNFYESLIYEKWKVLENL